MGIKKDDASFEADPSRFVIVYLNIYRDKENRQSILFSASKVQ